MLSREEFERLRSEAVDPTPRGQVRNPYDNIGLTDEELVKKIEERNNNKQFVYKLLMEYKRRLKQRGL